VRNYITPYIKRHGLERLVRRSKLIAKPSAKFPELVLLKYHMTESPMGSAKVQQCRGLIVNRRTGAPAAWPYNKFFNLHEGHAAKIDWSTARVYEKLDGSICTIYHYAGRWHVATSGDPDAGGPLGDTGTTFAEHFWKTWDNLGYELPQDTGCCYMFELMTPENEIVIRHERPRIVLHGVRRMGDLQEMRPEEIAARHGWECVATHDITSEAEAVETASRLAGTASEGFVVVDANWNRVKIKAPDYVRLHHLRSRWNRKNVFAAVQAGEADELCAYFPSRATEIREIERAVNALADAADALVMRHGGTDDMKTFALAIGDHPAKHGAFAIKRGVMASGRKWMESLRVLTLMDACDRLTTS
jgi:hypothetical protein